MGQQARVHARAKYCANDVIPQYERYYEKVLEQTGAVRQVSAL